MVDPDSRFIPGEAAAKHRLAACDGAVFAHRTAAVCQRCPAMTGPLSQRLNTMHPRPGWHAAQMHQACCTARPGQQRSPLMAHHSEPAKASDHAGPTFTPKPSNTSAPQTKSPSKPRFAQPGMWRLLYITVGAPKLDVDYDVALINGNRAGPPAGVHTLPGGPVRALKNLNNK